MNLTPLRIEPELGHIDTHAKMLVAIACATGREVREDFNGDDLIAKPGMSAAEVQSDWDTRRSDRQAGRLTYEVFTRPTGRKRWRVEEHGRTSPDGTGVYVARHFATEEEAHAWIAKRKARAARNGRKRWGRP